jgi:hypothetical protein
VNALFYAAAALYPVLVFCGLVVLKLPLKAVSLAVAASGLLFFAVTAGSAGGVKKKGRSRPCSLPRWACSAS